MTINVAKLSPTRLVEDLDYQTTPGCHTFGTGDCGHFARGCSVCADCLDAELLRRGIDVTVSGSRFVYVRDSRIHRKQKGNPDDRR